MKTLSVVKSVAVAAVLSAAFAAPAFARGEVFTARLQAPAGSERVIAQSTVWSCLGDSCVARPDHASSVRACRAFVREAGPVTAYGPDNARLNEQELAACNESARAPRTSDHARN
ncbi:MAG: hypothetical protein JNJ73_01205 [Hyphomonadaceae bacterium]|nr:hypothetical protein [Hyphomonadaceae bacterium]